jgi:hypothetical protein
MNIILHDLAPLCTNLLLIGLGLDVINFLHETIKNERRLEVANGRLLNMRRDRPAGHVGMRIVGSSTGARKEQVIIAIQLGIDILFFAQEATIMRMALVLVIHTVAY